MVKSVRRESSAEVGLHIHIWVSKNVSILRNHPLKIDKYFGITGGLELLVRDRMRAVSVMVAYLRFLSNFHLRKEGK